MKHHDTLRLRLTQEANVQVADPGKITIIQGLDLPLQLNDICYEIDLSTETEGQKRVAEINYQLQSSLNIHTGPIMRLALFRFGGRQPDHLLWIIHHLAVDLVSWRILLPDLWMVYDQLEQNKKPQLPAKTSSFKAWAKWLTEYAQQASLHTELAYWLTLAQHNIIPLPVDKITPLGQENTVASAEIVELSLSEAETRALLQDVPNVYHTQINDILLTALVQAFASWTGNNSLLLDLEGHGREELTDQIDLSRTVGWFTSIFPVWLSLKETLGESLKSIKEQLRQIPNQGLGYGVLRYLSPTTMRQLAELPQAEISFNYGGQFKAITMQSLGEEWAKEEQLGYLFNINGAVVNDQLSISWLYSRNLYQRETIELLANRFIQTLRDLIAHCQSPEAGGYTSSDFPLVTFTQKEPDKLIGSGKNVQEIYPLSPMQTNILFHSLPSPNSGVYFTQIGFQLKGELQSNTFQQAWQQLVDRHPIFRTGFVWQGVAQPIQIVYQKVRLAWDEQDWRSCSSEEQQIRLEQLLQNERAHGFDLSHAPLMKCNLLRLTETTYHLLWHCHHLLIDGWSLPIVLKELFSLYEQQPLPPTLPYRAYIAWLQQQDMTQAEHFWKEQLQDFTAPTPLGSLSQEFAFTSHHGNYQEEYRSLAATTTAELQELVQHHHLTLNTLVQAAWALSLQHYSGKSDIVFGVTVSGRSAPIIGIDSMVGLLINSLPLRIKIPNEMSLLSLLHEIMQTQIKLESFAYTSLDMIQYWLNIPSHQPLFLTNLRFQNYPAHITTYGQITIDNFHEVDWWHYPLNFIVIPGSEMILSISYNSHYFDKETVLEILEYTEKLLIGFVTKIHSETLYR